MALKFGQNTAADNQEERENQDDSAWIRYFKAAETRIRFAPYSGVDKKGNPVTGTKAWPTEREHYHPKIGSFPCTKDQSGECYGCSDPADRVKTKSRKYYFWAIDDQGQPQIFKMGVKLWQRFTAREERIGQLTDRDYLILKSGKDLDTEYDIESGEKYKVKFSDFEFPDIPEAIGAAYAKAEEFYSAEKDGGSDPEPDDDDDHAPVRKAPARKAATRAVTKEADEEDEEDDVPVRRGRIGKPADDDEEEEEEPAPRTRIAAKKAATKKVAARRAPEPVEDEEQMEAEEEDPQPRKATVKQAATRKGAPIEFELLAEIEKAETATLKDYLDQEGVEYPARASRQRLVDMTAKTADVPTY